LAYRRLFQAYLFALLPQRADNLITQHQILATCMSLNATVLMRIKMRVITVWYHTSICPDSDSL